MSDSKPYKPVPDEELIGVLIMNATTILCILLLSLSIAMTLFWLVRSIIDTVEEHKRDKRNAEWDAEHKKLCEKRDAEYHAARMKELENK